MDVTHAFIPYPHRLLVSKAVSCVAFMDTVHCLTMFLKSHASQQPGYSTSGNPTRSCLEKCLAALEHAKYGMFP
ncbi:hypothetical protein HPB48_021702 [Haemaphysalis longicornis]|uniref:Uncharacterized protein n=1 Tax=Haemaphysalis longicornis TaxID=44386 RepID=A0A9J6FUX6_HAELO|nr:hypothetical protein HPB48_021702 [Haemaphysalis longicornis]